MDNLAIYLKYNKENIHKIINKIDFRLKGGNNLASKIIQTNTKMQEYTKLKTDLQIMDQKITKLMNDINGLYVQEKDLNITLKDKLDVLVNKMKDINSQESNRTKNDLDTLQIIYENFISNYQKIKADKLSDVTEHINNNINYELLNDIIVKLKENISLYKKLIDQFNFSYPEFGYVHIIDPIKDQLLTINVNYNNVPDKFVITPPNFSFMENIIRDIMKPNIDNKDKQLETIISDIQKLDFDALIKQTAGSLDVINRKILDYDIRIEQLNKVMGELKILENTYKQLKIRYNNFILYLILIVYSPQVNKNIDIYIYLDKATINKYLAKMQEIMKKIQTMAYSKDLEDKKIIYFSEYHYFTLLRLISCLSYLSSKIADGKWIDIDKSSEQIKIELILFNHFRHILDKY